MVASFSEQKWWSVVNVCHFDAGCAAVMMCFDMGHEERGGEEKGRERVRVRGGGGGGQT